MLFLRAFAGFACCCWNCCCNSCFCCCPCFHHRFCGGNDDGSNCSARWPRWRKAYNLLIPLQRRVAILGMCVCVGVEGAEEGDRSPRPQTFAPAARASCPSRAAPRGLSMKPHRDCVAATHGVLYTNTFGAAQQPQGPWLFFNSTIVAAQQAGDRPENIKSVTNGSESLC